MFFTIDEKMIINIYSESKPDRDTVIAKISESIPYVADEETKSAMHSIISKAAMMSQGEFSRIDLSDIPG